MAKTFLGDAVATSPHARLRTLDTTLTLAIPAPFFDELLSFLALLLALTFFLLALFGDSRFATCQCSTIKL